MQEDTKRPTLGEILNVGEFLRGSDFHWNAFSAECNALLGATDVDVINKTVTLELHETDKLQALDAVFTLPTEPTDMTLTILDREGKAAASLSFIGLKFTSAYLRLDVAEIKEVAGWRAHGEYISVTKV